MADTIVCGIVTQRRQENAARRRFTRMLFVITMLGAQQPPLNSELLG